MTILRKYRVAIGWMMTDIMGLSPAIVQHGIHLNEEANQRVTCSVGYPNMQEVVRAEIVKLLDKEIIYPISDSKCVNPVHAVPKKSDFTMVENKNQGLVQTQLPTKVRVCIDY